MKDADLWSWVVSEETQVDDMIAFISEPGCMSKLAEGNYYESIVALLDKAEE